MPDSVGSQRLRLRVDAPKPHEQGAWVLRFGSVGAVVGADGGRPTRRGLPPAAFGGMGRRGRCRPSPKKGIPKGLGRLSSKCNSLEEDIERRAPVETFAGPVVDQIKDALKLRL